MELHAAAHPPPLELPTVSATMVVFVTPPPVPVMVTVAEPAVAELLAVRVSVEVVLPSAGGVIEPEDNDAVTPEGSPETLSDTAESKSSLLATVIVLVPETPCAMDKLLGESDNENDGWLDVVPHEPPGPVQLPRSDVNSLL